MNTKPIEGFRYYEVSDCGKVLSIKRKVRIGRSFRYVGGISLKSQINKYGYPVVCLRNGSGLIFTKTVHRLMANAFIPNPDKKVAVNHIDGNKRNNLLSNLEWATLSENSTHSCRVLGNNSGARHYKSILTEEDVLDIRSVAQLGASQRSIASAFGVSRSTIVDIIKGKNWASV